MRVYGSGLRYASFLTILIVCALLLSARMIYVFIADPQRFPIRTIKIAASYQHITRKQLEEVLSGYLNESFVVLSVDALQHDLSGLDWAHNVTIERVWPDTLNITMIEKMPVAIWNDSLMTEEGHLFHQHTSKTGLGLPKLSGPQQQKLDILQKYQKLSKLLSTYGLTATALQVRDNQAWELTLADGSALFLGKRDLEKRLMRFCRAYSLVFAEKSEQLFSVDLRYARGMAVQWKQQTGR